MSAIYVLVGGEQQGPFTFAELREHVKHGKYPDDQMAWHEGMEDWQPIHTIIEQEEQVEVIAEGPNFTLTHEDLIIGSEIFSLEGVVKAEVEVERTRRVKPAILSIVFGFLVVLLVALPHKPESSTTWVIWSLVLAVFLFLFLRNLLSAFAKGATFVAIHLTNGDDRIIELPVAEAREIAREVNSHIEAIKDHSE